MSTMPHPDADICSICLAALVQPGMDVFTTACQHQFHFTCLVKSVTAQNLECPLCRTRLEALSNIIQAPPQAPTPAPAPTAPPTTGGFWSSMRNAVGNLFTSSNAASSPLQNSSLRRPSNRQAAPTQSSEDPVDETVIRALTARIQAARQNATNSSTELPLITATTTLEFGGQVSTSASNIYGMVTLKAPSLLPVAASDEDTNELRVPVDLVCIVDQSGSMQGEKIALLKKTLDYIIDQMSPLDRLAIVSFDTNAHDRSAGLKLMTVDKKRTLHTAVSNIYASGGTYIGSGLEMAIRLLVNRQTKNPVGAMLLLTDGQDNQRHNYHQLMQTLPEGVVCHTFGYGLGHNAALLSQLAEQGHGGTFTFIDQTDAIAIAFGTALGSLFTCVAQNLSVRLEFGGAYALTHSHSVYRHEPTQLPSSTVTFKLTDLNSEESRNLVFQLNIPALPEPSGADDEAIGRVTLEYTDAISGRQVHTSAVPFRLARPSQLAPDSPLLTVNYALDLQRNRAEVSRVLKEAATESDYERARELINAQLTRIRASVSAQDPLCQELIRDMEQQYSNQEQFRSTMMNMHMQHGQERATYSTIATTSAACYMTGGQDRFRTLARNYK